MVGAELREAMAFYRGDNIAPWLIQQGFSTHPVAQTECSIPCLSALSVVLLALSAPQGLLLYVWGAWPLLLLAQSRSPQMLWHELCALGGSRLPLTAMPKHSTTELAGTRAACLGD